MTQFILSSDSCCDMPEKLLKEKEIYSIPLTFVTDWKGKLEERLDNFIGDEEKVQKFYGDVSEGMMAKTSQLSMHDQMEYFKGILTAEQKDVVHITLSSGLSGTYEQAVLAAKMIQEEIPEHRVYVVDSLSATAGQRMLADEAVRMREEGLSAEQAAAKLTEISRNIHHWIIVDDLIHLKRGGRVSGATAAIGTLLNIKPILSINHEGKLVVLDKVRGMKKSVAKVVKMAEKYGENMEHKKIYVVYTSGLEYAEELKQGLINALGADAEIMLMGPVIGAHVGPGCVACGFIGKPRVTDLP